MPDVHTVVRPVSLLEAIDDPALIAPAFDGPSWWPWRVFLQTLFGAPLTDPAALALFRACTGRETPQTTLALEAWMVVGRRGGKSRIAALLAVLFACLVDYRPFLAPGERGVFMVLAADRKQARVIMRFIKGLLQARPVLRALVSKSTAESVHLTNRIDIEVHTASSTSIRGYSCVGAVCDEIAFWPTEDAADPDTEILNALRPAMATVDNAAPLLVLSSPYARRGELYTQHQQHFGKADDPILVWQAPSDVMHPNSPKLQREMARAFDADPARAAAEYGAQFRSDCERLIPPEVIDRLVVPGRVELPPMAGVAYVAATDPSGGSSDSMTLAIAHREGPRAVLDVVREVRPPFSPEAVVEAFCAILQAYRCTSVTGDKYGGEWPRERFRAHQVNYQISAQTKSEAYAALVPLMNGTRVELLEHRRLQAQLVGLERRATRGGRDAIDHGPGQHDDVANAAALALVKAAGASGSTQNLEGGGYGSWHEGTLEEFLGPRAHERRF